MKFETWLKKQRNRDDVIGDVSRDFLDSNCKTVEESIKKYPPSDEIVWDCIQEAFTEFCKGTLKMPPFLITQDF